MSEHVKRAADGASRKRAWLDGRGRRREYWLWVAPLTLLDIALGVLVPNIAVMAGLPFRIVTFLFTIRRFHDIGWSGYAVPVVNIALVVLSFALGGVLGVQGGALATLVLSLGVRIAVGIWPGQRAINRYGSPAAGKDVSEVFA